MATFAASPDQRSLADMHRPRYSIVIPTRHRPHTLPHTLATVRSQEHDSFEIIVADNASGPETRRVVESVADTRITYIRSDTPLPMSENWHRALAACRGEWITFIGDDDGLMPMALPRVDALISAHPVDSLHHRYAVYAWPCADATGQGNRLQISLEDEVHTLSARSQLTAMMRDPRSAPIPLPYHGWIRRSLIARATTHGRLFSGKDPDTFAGILLAAYTDTFVSVSRPLSMVGISGTSNTFQLIISGRGGDTKKDVDALHARDGIVRHPLVPDVPNVPAVILDGLLRVRDAIGDDAFAYQPTPREIALHCLRGVWRADAEGLRQLDVIRSSLASAADRDALDAAVHDTPPSGKPPSMFVGEPGRHGTYAVHDVRPLGVRTVADATVAAAALLESHHAGRARSTTSPVAAPSVAESGQRRTIIHSLRRWLGRRAC